VNSSNEPTEINYNLLTEYIFNSTGLDLVVQSEIEIQIEQKADNKVLLLPTHKIETILTRFDEKGDRFLQVNYLDGCKILVTDRLIGFKPDDAEDSEGHGVQLPNVVTTPDIISVIEAIENSMFNDEFNENEIRSLKTLYNSVLSGAEKAGFTLSEERTWLSRLNLTYYRGAA
jgi:hypothetical protein